MLKVACLIATALAVAPHHAAFLAASHHDEPEEVMGPNMNFTPVSTTMQCTISLTLQYMTIFVALGVCRSYLDYKGQKYEESTPQVALEAASSTVFFAPMVCLMFVGFRMRVLQLSNGTGNPQDWVRYSMQAVAYSILANTIMVLVIPFLVNKKADEIKGMVDKETGELKTDGQETFDPKGNFGMLNTVFQVIRYLTFLGLYVGFGAVCTGVFLYTPPAGTWEGEIPALSPAVACTMTLSTAFFLVYFLHAASRTWTQCTKGEGNKGFEQTMERAASTMAMAPMLCALFLAARMRALQMDPVNGNPQRWAQNCFYACTYAVTFQTCMAVAAKYVLKWEEKEEKDLTDEEKQAVKDGAKIYKAPEGYGATIFSVCRWLAMISVYCGSMAVVCSVYTIEHPDGKEHTPALSPTMQCVLGLAFQFFFIYFLLWVFYTVEDRTGYTSAWMNNCKNAIRSAKSTVEFAPMLSVLFIATRMRALQISNNKGSPQGWAQDGMYLATWSILLQFLMCLIMPFFVKDYKNDVSLDGGNEKTAEDKKASEDLKANNSAAWWTITVFRYIAVLALIGGVATVITSVFLITPETANGRGSIPLVSDGTLGVNLAPPPVGVQDMPGAEAGMETAGSAAGTVANGVADGADVVASPVADGASAATEAVTG